MQLSQLHYILHLLLRSHANYLDQLVDDVFALIQLKMVQELLQNDGELLQTDTPYKAKNKILIIKNNKDI